MPPGPGAISLGGQVPVDGNGHDFSTVDGVRITVHCQPAPAAVFFTVASGAAGSSLYGWGTK